MRPLGRHIWQGTFPFRTSAAITIIGLGLGVAACGSSPSSSSSGAATPSTGSSGAPNLAGQTIRVAIGSPPQTTDTTTYLMVQILKSWGANASIVNEPDGPTAATVILSGNADVGAYDLPVTAINSGTVIFGASAPVLDYDFVGAPGIKSMAELLGHVYGTSNTHGVEAEMLTFLLQKYNIKPSQIRVVLAGSASARVAAMLTHHIDATFVHSEDTPQLVKAGFHILAQMPVIAPELGDSYLSSTPQWLSAHPSLAVAVDKAWIKAAQMFHSDMSQWISAAVTYAGAGTTTADATTTYQNLKASNSFPVAKSDLTSASMQTQENLSAQVGGLNGAPPPLSKFFTIKYWDEATAALGIN